MKGKQIGLRLDADLLEKINNEAQEQGRTISGMIRFILLQAYGTEPPRGRG